MRDIIMATQKAQALNEWLQQFPPIPDSTDETADVTPPPAPTGRTARGRSQQAKTASKHQDLRAEVGTPNTQGGSSFRQGAWKVTVVNTPQQGGIACGAHCAVNSATATWAGKKTRLKALDRVRRIWGALT